MIERMTGLSVFSFAFKRKDMAVQMKTKSSVMIEGEKVDVDPQLLFQRLITIYSMEELETSFGHELSTRPMSLFDKDGYMNEADKPKLKHALKTLLGETNHVVPLDAWLQLMVGHCSIRCHGNMVKHFIKFTRLMFLTLRSSMAPEPV